MYTSHDISKKIDNSFLFCWLANVLCSREDWTYIHVSLYSLSTTKCLFIQVGLMRDGQLLEQSEPNALINYYGMAVQLYQYRIVPSLIYCLGTYVVLKWPFFTIVNHLRVWRKCSCICVEGKMLKTMAPHMKLL